MARKILLTALTLILILSSAFPALAQSDIGPKALGPRLGYVKPSDIDGTFGFGGVLDLGSFAPRWGFDFSLDYWSKSESSVLGKAKLSDVVLGFRARYEFAEPSESTRPYLFAGPAIHFIKASIDIVAVGDASETDTEFGMDVGAGVDIAASPKMDVFFEGGYRAVSDVGQWVILGGVMFGLGN
jgi:opacity protein-like surface antigen